MGRIAIGLQQGKAKQGWHSNKGQKLKIDAKSGVGDVVIEVDASRRIRAECKGGLLIKKHGSPEYRILREAIGQVITVEQISDQDLMAVAVPLTPGFKRLAVNWRQRPLMVHSGIQIALVGRDRTVEWLLL